MTFHRPWPHLGAAALLAAAAALPLALPARAGPIEYPKARTVDQVDDFFGTKVADPYRWLEKVDDPEVQAWVEAENAITRGYLDRIDFRPQVARRLTELLDYPRYFLPVKHGSYYFFRKNSGLQNQAVLYKQKGPQAAPEVLLDPNALSKDGTLSLEALDFTPDGRLMAYGLSQSGSDWQVLHVRDVATAKDREDKLERCRFTDIAWAPDGGGFYYSRYPQPGSVAKGDEEHYQKLYFHKVGDAQGSDRLVYERPEDRQLGTSASVSDDGRWLVIHVWKGTAPENEIFVQRLGATPPAGIEPLRTGFDASYDFIESVGDRLYFITDKDAPRKRVVAVDMGSAGKAVQEIVPQDRDVLETAVLANGQFVLGYMHDAHHNLRTCALDGTRKRDVKLPTLGALAGLSGRPQDEEVFVGFTSFLFPTQIYRLDFRAGELALFQGAKIAFDSEPYTVRQIFYESKDGTSVPMFLVHKRGLCLNGDNPTLLYGYGGFDISLTPSFSTSRLFWLEQGGVYAVANLRGGGEFGEEWHKAGTLERKQNVFDDFIAAAQWLEDNGYTRPERLAIQGGSNGGLLTAACTVQRPDLFGVVLSQVPVIDMLRYHRFTIGSYWKPDYGDPETPEGFKYLYAYSPLHNIKPGTHFPAMLITTADTDTRVHPAHAKKFAATLQAANVSDKPILLRVETKAGHGAGKPTSKQIEEAADFYSFVMERMGMKPAAAPAVPAARSGTPR